MSLKCQWNMIKQFEQGLQDAPHCANSRFALRNLQSDVPEKQSDFTKETLASQNTKMISSIVISQLMDGSKSSENGASLPVPCAYPQPPACSGKQALASRSGVAIHRALAFLPATFRVQTPSEELGPPPPQGEPPAGTPQRGFSSITVTARRVGPPASTLVWEVVGDPLCTKCRDRGAVLRDPSAPATGSDPRRHRAPFPCTEFPRSSSGVQLAVPEAHARLCDGHGYWVANVDREDGFSPDAPLEGRGPLVFSSCVHLRVSQQCPNAIYYLDRSLSAPAQQPQAASPKMHRSVLSLSLSCSSHSPTPDGAGGPANAPPGSGAPRQEPWPGQQEPWPGQQDPWGGRWSPGLPEGLSKEGLSLRQVHLGPGSCPRSAAPLLDDTESRDAERSQVTLRRGTGPRAPWRSRGGANQLSIHIPGWSYRKVDTKVISGSNEKQPGEARVTLSAPAVERKLARDLLPNGHSSPSNSCQLSPRPEPPECQQQGFRKPRAPRPGLLCPFPDSGASPQEDSAGQVEREAPGGDHTCCDLVVKIKEYKENGGPSAPKPEPVSPEPAPPDEPETPGPSEDYPEGQQAPASPLTLQEALEVHKPQFISRSQERLKKLEHMVHQRKAQRQESLGPAQSLLPVRANKKQFTVPHPLSDNLFKPKERCISEKEMQMRSKRIYNNLPEVKKKKEEQKKRVILQSNRLRAEVFKKQLLDQLLQRKAV
ncbi:(E2-independent) E3 ubiquitin-conjugating enzyme FATS [Talpa occidentalis]|uniref:(E2-independent) E3 ubiquitin-conjugating enzyme FATS n=1 Tax=Talpa occidentalis TaxID=50954 RepID=UPI0018902617|nr:(E2-independent) E3 ubiquitin-conjugating enzyme FATS [Talpa occidentalis]